MAGDKKHTYQAPKNQNLSKCPKACGGVLVVVTGKKVKTCNRCGTQASSTRIG